MVDSALPFRKGEATMPRARYPGASERELYRTTRIDAKPSGTRIEVVLLTVVLIVTAAQLIW
jgi:hypothetical protein